MLETSAVRSDVTCTKLTMPAGALAAGGGLAGVVVLGGGADVDWGATLDDDGE